MLAAVIRISHRIATLAAGLAIACASAPPKPPPPPEWTDALHARADALEAALAAEPPAAAGELLVRLAFEPGADLDLSVSDPLDETVYYGRTPVRSGGTLDADRRCAGAGERIETVRFTAPLAGLYRVGVDFQQRCEDGDRISPWAISIESHGERRVLRGLAVWNVYASRVDEFVY